MLRLRSCFSGADGFEKNNSYYYKVLLNSMRYIILIDSVGVAKITKFHDFSLILMLLIL